jgi:hypothetical protein
LENLARPSLGCGVTYFVVFDYYLFGLLDHFFWTLFFGIWAREHIAQMGFLCVWLGLEESFFFLQLQCIAIQGPFLIQGVLLRQPSTSFYWSVI